MANNYEMIQRAMDEFVAIQQYMLTARKEGAKETYEQIKIRYATLKALLSVYGVNLETVDVIKE